MGVRRTSSGVAVLLLLAACGQGSREADVAAEPSAEEVVCLDGSYESAEIGEVVPREQVCPEESPSVSPSDSPSRAASSTPAAAALWELGAAFLTPEAAADVDPGGWAVLADAKPEAGPLLDPCGAKAFPRSADLAASAERTIGWQATDDPEGSEVTQEVFRYSSAEGAEQAFADYADAVECCPRVDDEQAEGFYLEHAVVRQDEAGGVRRLLVRRQPCQEPNACTAHFASYLMVAQAADGVTAASYGISTDGDPAEVAPLVLAAVAEQLGRTVSGT